MGIDARDFVAFRRFSADWARTHPKPDATIDQVADHIEHVRQVAGIDHVGLGGDYDGTDTYPLGLEDVSGYRVSSRRSWTGLVRRRPRAARARQHAAGHARRRGGRPDLQTTRAPSIATIAELDG